MMSHNLKEEYDSILSYTTVQQVEDGSYVINYVTLNNRGT